MLLFSRYWRCWAGSWKSRGAFERNVAAAARRLRLVISRLFQTISESKMVSLATQFLKVLKGKRVKVTVKSTSYTGVIERISQNPNKILVLSEGQSIMYFVYLLFFVCMSAPHILEEDKKHGAVLVFFFFCSFPEWWQGNAGLQVFLWPRNPVRWVNWTLWEVRASNKLFLSDIVFVYNQQLRTAAKSKLQYCMSSHCVSSITTGPQPVTCNVLHRDCRLENHQDASKLQTIKLGMYDNCVGCDSCTFKWKLIIKCSADDETKDMDIIVVADFYENFAPAVSF